MKQCRNCGRPIVNYKALCGGCEWAATRPARLIRRKTRVAFVLDYENLTEAGFPELVPARPDAG